ncbi:hypothetical protein H0V99_01405 [Candidatus Saccharibacteria bacterium]|nr:hypothetical protein [Candidatus Saccharibacteria bacterium]
MNLKQEERLMQILQQSNPNIEIDASKARRIAKFLLMLYSCELKNYRMEEHTT